MATRLGPEKDQAPTAYQVGHMHVCTLWWLYGNEARPRERPGPQGISGEVRARLHALVALWQQS